MKYGYARVPTRGRPSSWSADEEWFAIISHLGVPAAISKRLGRSLRDLITTLDDLRTRGREFQRVL